jgi:hypothetical protein
MVRFLRERRAAENHQSGRAAHLPGGRFLPDHLRSTNDASNLVYLRQVESVASVQARHARAAGPHDIRAGEGEG